ncbi:hypothetical protein Aperf_G00000050471 [Anoplocephala perfoliata]
MRGKVRIEKSRCFIRKTVIVRHTNENGDQEIKFEGKYDGPRCYRRFTQRKHKRRSGEKQNDGKNEVEFITIKSQLSPYDCECRKNYEKTDLRFMKLLSPDLINSIRKCVKEKRSSKPIQNLAESQNHAIELDQENFVNPSVAQIISATCETQEEKLDAKCCHMLMNLWAKMSLFSHCFFLLVIQSVYSGIAKISRNNFLNDGLNALDPNTGEEIEERKTNEEKPKSEENLETSLNEQAPEFSSSHLEERGIMPVNEELVQNKMTGISSDYLEESPEFECDLLDILTSQTILFGIWLFNGFSKVIQAIDSRTKSLINTCIRNKGLICGYCRRQSEAKTPENCKILEECGMFRTTMKEMETSGDKVPTLDVIQGESMSLLEPKAELFLCENIQPTIMPKLQDTPATEGLALLKAPQQENVLAADGDKNAEIPEGNEIKDPIPNELEVPAAAKDQSTVEEDKKPEGNLAPEKSKVSHSASVDSCFKSMLEKFCPESAAVIEQMKMNEDCLKKDADEENSVSSSIEHEATLANCYMYLVENYHPDLALILKKYCDEKEPQTDLSI